MPGLGPLITFIENLLIFLHTWLGSWGLAIILFTLTIKLLTWPLTSKQLKSSKKMHTLQPKIKAVQEKYKDNKEKQTEEIMALYQEMGVNPLMGCLPMLVQFPIWISLYRAILLLANEGYLKDRFLWLPSLACPNSNPAVCDITPLTGGFGWVFDVASWGVTWPYLILPLIIVTAQFGVNRLMSSSSAAQNREPTQAAMAQMTIIMPLMFGFFALRFPAGLGLYWMTSNFFAFFQYFMVNKAGQA